MAKRGLNRLLGFFMSFVLLVTLMPKISFLNRSAAADEERWAYVNVCGDRNILKIRQNAGLGYAAVADAKGNPALVYGNQKVQILSEKIGTDKELWYYISYDCNGKNYKGYIRHDFIMEPKTAYDEEYASELREKGFPEDYIDNLCYLHSLHPTWVFTPYFTGGGTSIDTSLDWATSLKKENTLGYSLVSMRYCKTEVTGEYFYSWFSHVAGAYNPLTDEYTSYDTGNWVQASNEILAYYMDPRNFLNEKGISQFRSQAFNPQIQTLEGTKEVIKNSFMNGTYDGKNSYASLLMIAAEKSGVSPYILANKIMQEVGTKGQTGSVSGTVKGYEGLYNYFNVGAAQRNGVDAITNGLIYASKTDAATLRPWNSRYKAVVGGSIFFGNMYVNKGQSNHYLQKFNFSTFNTYAHQYMGNILDPANQAYGAYNKNTDYNDPAEFLIPVFKGMPETPCPMPLGYASPNSYLKALSINNVSLTPTFNYKTLEYSTIVASNVNAIIISAAAVNAQAKITGSGTKKLVDGNNQFDIVVTAGDGTTTTYKISVYKQESYNPLCEDDNISVDVYKLSGNYIVGPAPGTTIDQFLSKITLKDTNIKKIKKPDGTEVDGSSICVTGYILETANSNYVICVNGDVYQDGIINAKDLLLIRQYLLKTRTLDQAQLYAGNVSDTGNICAKDLLIIRKHLLKYLVIKDR
ncbi:MAG: cadherin-like beta sandwich domain-containing protein [Lachnospiraceae bacterium]|nr:cadherin-like beta sandwich domain-containing protein [Lachnospiraceae bacterium]